MGEEKEIPQVLREAPVRVLAMAVSSASEMGSLTVDIESLKRLFSRAAAESRFLSHSGTGGLGSGGGFALFGDGGGGRGGFGFGFRFGVGGADWCTFAGWGIGF